MTIGELIEFLQELFAVIVELFSKYFGGDKDAEGEAPEATV